VKLSINASEEDHLQMPTTFWLLLVALGVSSLAKYREKMNEKMNVIYCVQFATVGEFFPKMNSEE